MDWLNKNDFHQTAYVIHLADIKFGELECNANWQAFSLVNRVNKTAIKGIV